MPQTKPDKRFERYNGFLIFGLMIAGLVAVPIMFAADKFHSTVLWVVLGILISSVAAAGFWYSAWIFRYYRCPQCHSRLHPEPGPSNAPLPIRYHCPQCDVIWESGMNFGGE